MYMMEPLMKIKFIKDESKLLFMIIDFKISTFSK